MSKDHLIKTVDELQKYNMRRRLKGAVMAAVSSSKWASFQMDVNCETDLFSDFGEDEVTSSGNLHFIHKKCKLFAMYSAPN